MAFLFALLFSLSSMAKEEVVTPPAIAGIPSCVADQICHDETKSIDDQFATAFARCTVNKTYDSLNIELSDLKATDDGHSIQYSFNYTGKGGARKHLEAFFGCGLNAKVATGCGEGKICSSMRAEEIPKQKANVMEAAAKMIVGPRELDCNKGSTPQWSERDREYACVPCLSFFGGQTRYLETKESEIGCFDKDGCEMGREFLKQENRCVKICHHKPPSRNPDGSCKDRRESQCEGYEKLKSEFKRWIMTIPSEGLSAGDCDQLAIRNLSNNYIQHIEHEFQKLPDFCSPDGWISINEPQDVRNFRDWLEFWGSDIAQCNWRKKINRRNTLSPSFKKLLEGPNFDLIKFRWEYGLDEN